MEPGRGEGNSRGAASRRRNDHAMMRFVARVDCRRHTSETTAPVSP